MRRPPTPKQQQKLVDAWNSKHPVGTTVIVRLDDGDEEETTTRHEAQLLGGHTAVIWLVGVSGAYSLDCVRAK